MTELVKLINHATNTQLTSHVIKLTVDREMTVVKAKTLYLGGPRSSPAET